MFRFLKARKMNIEAAADMLQSELRFGNLPCSSHLPSVIANSLLHASTATCVKQRLPYCMQDVSATKGWSTAASCAYGVSVPVTAYIGWAMGLSIECRCRYSQVAQGGQD